MWLGLTRMLFRHRVGWPQWPVVVLSVCLSSGCVVMFAGLAGKQLPIREKPPRRQFALWSLWRIFLVLVVAAGLRHVDPTMCADSPSTARCALYDQSFATSYGSALFLGGLLACVLALVSRRRERLRVLGISRWRSVGWCFAAAVTPPFTVIAAVNRPWLRDTLVTSAILVGLRSVFRVLSPELTGQSFDDLLTSGRDAFDH